MPPLGPSMLSNGTGCWHTASAPLWCCCSAPGAALAALTGIPLSLRAEGGWVGRLSFLILTCLWLRAAWGAYASARRRIWKQHVQWVQVHYLLAWSAVFLRLGLGVTGSLGIPLQQVTPALAWLSWQPGFWLGCRSGLFWGRTADRVG